MMPPSGAGDGATSWPGESLTCSVLVASLPDLLVVQVQSPGGENTFQGALLLVNPTKSLSSPFGLHPPDGYDQHLKENNPRDYQDDSFHTLRRRHTYYQDLLAKENESGARATKLLMPKLSGGRKQLNVRLRARQVLCQSCRNVCNEKGEKVQTSSTHKTRQQQAQQKRNQRRSQQKQVEMTDALTNRKLTLVPKLKRLPPSEIEKYSDRSSDEGPATPDKKVLSATVKDGPSELRKQPLRIKLSNIQNAASVSGSSSGSSETTGVELRTLRKKRSAVGSMEDLWDETIFEEPSGSKESGGLGVNLVKSGGVEDSKSASQLATPVLKISFGKKKEVHRIPAKLHQVDEESTFRIEDESGNNLNNLETVENDENLLRQTEAAKKNKLAQEKAARKAVKRAKKEAQRRQASHSGSSPGYFAGGRSPAYYRSGGGCSPSSMSPARHSGLASPFAHPSGFSPGRYARMSPAYQQQASPVSGGGSASASPVGGGTSPSYSVILPSPNSMARGSHKIIIRKPVRQKKKKGKKKSKAHNIVVASEISGDIGRGDATAGDLFDEEDPLGVDPEHSQEYHFPRFHAITSEEAEILRHLQTVDSCVKETDSEMLCVGDDIWGRQVINEEDEEDYYWWPGKVTNIYLRPIEDDSGEIRPEASVKWYSVGITSVVICGQLKLFKENFQLCFNRAHSSSTPHYEDAVRMASESCCYNYCSSPGPTTRVSSSASSPPFSSPSKSPRTVNCLS